MCEGGRWHGFNQGSWAEDNGDGGKNIFTSNPYFVERLADTRRFESSIEQKIDVDNILNSVSTLLSSQKQIDAVKQRLQGDSLKEIALQLDCDTSSASRYIKKVTGLTQDIIQICFGVKKQIETANEAKAIKDQKLQVLYGNWRGKRKEEIMRDNKLDAVFVDKMNLEIRRLARIELKKIKAARKQSPKPDNASDHLSLADDTVN
jgi:hypothetical protein